MKIFENWKIIQVFWKTQFEKTGAAVIEKKVIPAQHWL
jgi:hypothetical protein